MLENKFIKYRKEILQQASIAYIFLLSVAIIITSMALQSMEHSCKQFSGLTDILGKI